MIDAEKLKNIKDGALYVVTAGADSWSPEFVKELASETLELVTEVERLQSLVALLSKNFAFEVGDTVREVGDEDPTGTIVQIKEGYDEKAYVVKLFRKFAQFDTITYYHNEIELIEREA